MTGQQIRSFWSRLAQQRNNPKSRDAEVSDIRTNPRYTRDTESEVIIDDAENEAYVEICDLEPADFDILEDDPELYIIKFLHSTDSFES